MSHLQNLPSIYYKEGNEDKNYKTIMNLKY